jgi:hypothetical protein
MCPDNATYTAETYTNATAHQGKCATADINAFEAACGDLGSNTACTTWFEMNVAGQMPDGGGAGTTCGNCIAMPKNNGGVFVDPAGGVSPNYGACIQLTDPTHGPACAAAVDNVFGCNGRQCGDCSNATFGTCLNTVNTGSGICAQYVMTQNTACTTDFADGGAANTCQPGGGNTFDPDFTYIIDLICGGGTPPADGGPQADAGPPQPDAGHD